MQIKSAQRNRPTKRPFENRLALYQSDLALKTLPDGDVRNAAYAVVFLQLSRQLSRHSSKKSEFPTRIGLRCTWSGTLPGHSVFVRCAAAILVGTPMKSAIADHLPDEHFVIRVDGRVKSHHRRFLDALREGLQLRDQFPQHDVKVQSMKADGRQRTALH
jgi:hypothetical protein